jgi:hypothetical protein
LNLLLLLLLAAGCRGPQAGPGGEVPAWAALAEAHNRRIDGLGQVYADGVVELRWTDDRGRRFEQGDVEVWLALPDRAAIDVTKFGERLLWVGCDARQAWVFEFDKKAGTALRRAGRDGPSEAGGDDLPVDPAIIIALAGLDRLPPADGTVVRDESRDAWVLSPGAHAAPIRVYLDRRTLLPLRVELLDEHGAIACSSRIDPRRYEPLRRDGIPVASGALFPTLLDAAGSDGRSAIKLSLRDPGPDPAPQGYFDLDWLSGRFQPARVAAREPATARAGAPRSP